MNRADVIAQLEAECLPRLENIAKELRARHPRFRINVGRGSVGGNTEFQGYHVYIECDRDGSENPEPNCVALEVCVRDLNRDPRLCALDVTWGADGVQPCGNTPDHLPAAVRWSDEAIALIRRTLPPLESELEFCLTAWENTYLITPNE